MRAEGFQVSGVVVNASSGQPLARTRIQIASTDDRDKNEIRVTGTDGRFQFRNVVPGKYQLVAQRAGYPTQALDQHGTYSSAVAVGPGKKSIDLVFRLKPEAVIAGTILDDANESVRDAEVVLFHRGVEDGRLATHLMRVTRSDDQGAYHFGQLLEGEYLIAVKARPWYAQSMVVNSGKQLANPDLNVAFPVTFYPGTSDPDSAATIKVRGGDRASADFNLRAVPAARINVHTTRRQISAHLEQRFFDDYEAIIETQNMFENDAFSILGVAPGKYKVYIDTPDNSDREIEVTVADEITVDADAPGNAGTVDVAGILSPLGGALPSPLSIRLESGSSGQRFGAQVGSDGKFEIKQVSPGDYEVRLSDVHSYVAQMAASGASIHGRAVKIGKSDVTLAIQASQSTGRITGTVMDGDVPQPGAMVLLVPDDPEKNMLLFRRDQSDSDGTFTLTDVVPGRYSLVALMDAWDLPYMEPGAIKPYLGKSESVVVAANGKYDVKVPLQKK